MKKRIRNIFISIFVVVWLCAFHYESIRYFYLEPVLGQRLPKIKFLFPPAGWIMFYRVDDQFAYPEIYGVIKGAPQVIDPHDIIRTRFIGFDNIRRGILGAALSGYRRQDFCRYMHRNFPVFDDFYVTAVNIPSVTKAPYDRQQIPVYQCGGK